MILKTTSMAVLVALSSVANVVNAEDCGKIGKDTARNFHYYNSNNMPDKAKENAIKFKNSKCDPSDFMKHIDEIVERLHREGTDQAKAEADDLLQALKMRGM